MLDQLVNQQNEKVVLWSFYRSNLDNLAVRYGPLGLVRVDGSIPSEERREAVRRFQEDDNVMVFLGNPAAAGAGLTLHRSRIAVYESLSNQAAHYLQSLDRIHRRGQAREVEYITLLCEGTIEEPEYNRLLTKAQTQAELLGDPPDPPADTGATTRRTSDTACIDGEGKQKWVSRVHNTKPESTS
ncbi:helicase-related protein [Nonomuraea ferruginea]